MDAMDLTVSDKILCEIGRVTIYQSHIETELAYFIQELLGIANDDRGDALTVKMFFRELVRVAGSLLRAEFGDDHEHVRKFNEFSKGAESVNSRRNELVHSAWGFGSDLTSETATRIKVSQKKSGTIKTVEPVRLEDLKALSIRMRDLLWDLSTLRVTICHHQASARRF